MSSLSSSPFSFSFNYSSLLIPFQHVSSALQPSEAICSLSSTMLRYSHRQGSHDGRTHLDSRHRWYVCSPSFPSCLLALLQPRSDPITSLRYFFVQPPLSSSLPTPTPSLYLLPTSSSSDTPSQTTCSLSPGTARKDGESPRSRLVSARLLSRSGVYCAIARCRRKERDPASGTSLDAARADLLSLSLSAVNQQMDLSLWTLRRPFCTTPSLCEYEGQGVSESRRNELES